MMITTNAAGTTAMEHDINLLIFDGMLLSFNNAG
jgi:hypothetical protein